MQVQRIYYDKINLTDSLYLGSSQNYIIAIIRNPAQYCWENRQITTERNAVVFLRPEQQIEIHRHSTNFLYELIEFSPEGWEISILNTLRLPDPVIFPSNVSQHTSSFRNIYNTFYSADNFRLEKVCHLVMLILYGCADGDVTPASATKREQLRHKLHRLRAMLSDYPTKAWSIAEGAKIADLSVSRFATVYKEQFGLSFMQDVIKTRIRHSQTLLLTTDSPVDQIATALGYNTVKLFYLQFKKEMGISPGEYRKANAEIIY